MNTDVKCNNYYFWTKSLLLSRSLRVGWQNKSSPEQGFTTKPFLKGIQAKLKLQQNGGGGGTQLKFLKSLSQNNEVGWKLEVSIFQLRPTLGINGESDLRNFNCVSPPPKQKGIFVYKITSCFADQENINFQIIGFHEARRSMLWENNILNSTQS